jgi:hypothetical protein
MTEKENYNALLDDIETFSKGNGLDELTELVVLAVDALTADRERQLMGHLLKANGLMPENGNGH